MCWGHPKGGNLPFETSVVAVTSLATLNEQDLKFLESAGRPRRLAPGEFAYKEGVRNDTLQVVMAGDLDAYVVGKQVANIRPGALLGELGFLSGQPAAATVRARTPATVLVVSGDDVRKQMRGSSEFAARFNQVMGSFAAARVRERLGADCYPPPSDEQQQRFKAVIDRLRAVPASQVQHPPGR
jgi:CRP-like cAMP-binding protein